MRNGIWKIPSAIRLKFLTFFYRHVNASPVMRTGTILPFTLFFKLKLCVQVLKFERIKVLTGSKVTAWQGVCWRLSHQPLRAVSSWIHVAWRAQTRTCNTSIQSFLTLHRNQTKKPLNRRQPAQAWTRARNCDVTRHLTHSRSSCMAYLLTAAGAHGAFITVMSWKWVLNGRPLGCALLVLF